MSFLSIFSSNRNKGTNDQQNISPPQPTMDAQGSNPSHSGSRQHDSGTTTGSNSSTPAASGSGDVTNATHTDEQSPTGPQCADVNNPAATGPPPYDPGNSDAPRNQMTETSSRTPAEGNGRPDGRDGKKPEDRIRKRDKQMRALEDENKNLKHENNKLLRRLEELDNAHKDLHKRCNTEMRRAAAERVEYQQQIGFLEHRHEELTASHIRSVTSVGTGLEPISDETFDREFRKLHDDISEWCRRTFKSYRGRIHTLREIDDIEKSEHSSILSDLLSTRIMDTIGMRVGDLMEIIVWGYIEQKILSPWFPQIPTNVQESAVLIQNTMRAADTSEPHEKAEFWRAYAASLIFQNPEVQADLQNVQTLSEELFILFRHVQTDPTAISPRSVATFQHHLRSAIFLAAQLKCQCQFYEIRDNVKVGAPYKTASMVYVKDLGLQETENIIVTCIISKSVVKRAYNGAKDVITEICKARVLVSQQ